VAAQLVANGPELLMDAWCPVEAAVPIKNSLHLGRDGFGFLDPTA